jgi:hypothetical protein
MTAMYLSGGAVNYFNVAVVLETLQLSGSKAQPGTNGNSKLHERGAQHLANQTQPSVAAGGDALTAETKVQV